MILFLQCNDSKPDSAYPSVAATTETLTVLHGDSFFRPPPPVKPGTITVTMSLLQTHPCCQRQILRALQLTKDNSQIGRDKLANNATSGMRFGGTFQVLVFYARLSLLVSGHIDVLCKS